MRHLTRVAIGIALFAGLAVVALADTTSGTSGSLNDFKVILNDPSCPDATICVDLGYDGQVNLPGLLFVAPSPVQIPAGQTAACGTNFGMCLVAFPGDGDGDSDDFFYGVLFLGTITPGQDLTIGVSGISNFSLLLPNVAGLDCPSCTNGVINFTSTPEPSTVLLLVAGLLLLGVYSRRRIALSARRA